MWGGHSCPPPVSTFSHLKKRRQECPPQINSPIPLPDRIAILIAENKSFAAPGNFTGEDGFHALELYFDANHGNDIAFVEDEIVSLHKFRTGKVDFNCLAGRQLQGQM